MNNTLVNSFNFNQHRSPNINYSNGIFVVHIQAAKPFPNAFGELTNNVFSPSDLGQYLSFILQNVHIHNHYATVSFFSVYPDYAQFIIHINQNNIPYHRCLNLNKIDKSIPIPSQKEYESSELVTALRKLRWKDVMIDDQMKYVSNCKNWLAVAVGNIKAELTRFAHQNQIPFCWKIGFLDCIFETIN